MRHGKLRAAIIRWVVSAFFVLPGLYQVHAQAQGQPGLLRQQTVQEIEAAVRALLSSRLGVPADELTPEVDLVNDLQIDQSTLYYELRRLYFEQGVEPPPVELRRIDYIASYIASAPGLRGAPTADQSYIQKVYFATNRKRNGDPKPDSYFADARAPLGKVTYGIAEVNIPSAHKKGQLESPWRRSSQDARKHIFVLKINEFEKAQFFDDILKGGGNTPDEKQILLYVHGFNVLFDDAIRRAAQITFDYQFKGVAMTFSWPSSGSVWSYNSDWANVLWSARHLESYLTELTEKFPDYRIHLVAHSMGSMGVLHALRLMAARGGKLPKIASVMLCAPDFDGPLFSEQIASEVRALSAHWVVYSSLHDFSLRASAKLNAAPRLGTPVTVADGFEVIDASNVEVTPWSVPETHSYYATKERVIDDMVKALSGLSPPQRNLSSKQVEGGEVWLLQ
jgi:esterase/lipase superfamily enzyme